MSSLGPLGPPPSAPIVNPVLWAPELPANRPQTHPAAEALHVQMLQGIRAHPLPLGAHGPSAAGGPGGVEVATPVDLELRAARAHEATFHHHKPAEPAGGPGDLFRAAAGITGAEYPAGAATTLTALGQELPSASAPAADDVAAASASAREVDPAAFLGDGSLQDAERAIQAVRGGPKCGLKGC